MQYLVDQQVGKKRGNERWARRQSREGDHEEESNAARDQSGAAETERPLFTDNTRQRQRFHPKQKW